MKIALILLLVLLNVVIFTSVQFVPLATHRESLPELRSQGLQVLSEQEVQVLSTAPSAEVNQTPLP